MPRPSRLTAYSTKTHGPSPRPPAPAGSLFASPRLSAGSARIGSVRLCPAGSSRCRKLPDRRVLYSLPLAPANVGSPTDSGQLRVRAAGTGLNARSIRSAAVLRWAVVAMSSETRMLIASARLNTDDCPVIIRTSPSAGRASICLGFEIRPSRLASREKRAARDGEESHVAQTKPPWSPDWDGRDCR